ncbi:sphingosine kinase 1 isoform X1 [Zalophus californianus]|uniref:Sphingosine kinase 1 n=2 Tax=Zalophus californianus TaxID=9704 RepID=A0A6J2FLJ8_ZALCA|nr:sphingosine kinase 1 isoform X1 [Zalophus californianus]
MPERAAPRAWSEDLAGRSPPQGAVPDSASAVSSPSDPAAAGDDAGASTAPAPGGEGDPLSPHRDARLGSTDKELKAGAAAAGSSPTALGTPWQRELRVEVMDPGSVGSISRRFQSPRFRPSTPVVIRGPLVAGWGRGLLGLVFPAGGARSQLPRPCRVLVLLNPRGGKGKALQLFRSHVQPLLAQADISFTLMLTERRNHARELVQVEELGRWDALVVMSGDGLMHEVVNGLMERPDWETAIRKPLCSLPAGSGNALAASLNHYAGYEQVTNEDLLTNCTLLLCRRLLAPMNLLSLQTASGLRLFSVLSLAWGFIADVDLESEKFRRLGEMRFTLGTFLRLAALRVYQGTLAYLPAERVVSQVPAPPSVERQDQQGPTDAHLVPLEEPVPPHWTVVPEQDFVLVLALLHSHLGSEMFAAPMGRCAAGTMHLFYVRAGVSRAMLLRLFLAMEKGRHMDYDCPYLVYVPVVAFRLEPKDGKGVFAVDGELMVSEAVQGQVHPDYIWMAGGCMEPPPSQKPQQGAPPGEPL